MTLSHSILTRNCVEFLHSHILDILAHHQLWAPSLKIHKIIASSRLQDPVILSSNSRMKSSFSVSTIARLQLFVHLTVGQMFEDSHHRLRAF